MEYEYEYEYEYEDGPSEEVVSFFDQSHPEVEYEYEYEYEEEEEEGEEEKVPKLIVTGPWFSEDALDDALERFIKAKRKKLSEVDGDMRRPLLQHITRRKVEAIERQDYNRAEELARAQDMLKQAISKDTAAADRTYSKIACKGRIEQAKCLYDETEKECEEKQRQIEKYLDEKEAEIRARHKEELKDFREFWNDPSTFHEFSKPSAHLLYIRKQEKKMALLGDFQAARDLKSKGNEQEKIETMRAQQRAKEAVEAAYQQLIKRQQTEMDAHRGLRAKLTGQARLYTEEQLYPISMAIKKLETSKEVKVIKMPKVSQSRLLKNRGLETQLYDDRPAVPTPRTAEKLAQMRAMVGSRSLKLSGVNTRPFIKKTQQMRRKQREAELKIQKEKEHMTHLRKL